jgi:hypothetical protein
MSLLSCKEEIIKEVPVPIVHSWSLDSTFFGENKFLLTSRKLNESTLLVGNSFSVWTVNLPDPHSKNINGHFIPDSPSASWYPPALSQTIGVSVIDADRLVVYPTRCPSCSGDAITISQEYTGSTIPFKGFPQADLIFSSNAGGYPVTSDGYILAPHEVEQGKATCLLIKIDTSATNDPVLGPHLALNSIKPVTLTHTFSLAAGAIYFSAIYYDKFFLSLYGGFFVVDKTGFARKINLNSPGPNRMFMLNNILFAMSGLSLFQSIDQGETWSLFSENMGTYANVYYFNVGDELYITSRDQIARVTLDGNTFNFTELDNDGLETNTITSINKCGKYAFVTTLAGLYYRDTTTFNTPKTP